MEAALRTVYELVTNKTLQKLDFTEVRGLEGIKECEVDLNGTKVKVCVVHTLSKAREVMEMIKSGKADYAFIEVMCCPGGCIGGGGQPYAQQTSCADGAWMESTKRIVIFPYASPMKIWP
jgi:NADH-quinone oxidoreductase subunit G/NADP-reducing hydrogenase subunit HndD